MDIYGVNQGSNSIIRMSCVENSYANEIIRAYRCAVLAIAGLLLLVMSAGSVFAAEEKPSVLVFGCSVADGMDKSLGSTAAKAIRDYLRETGKVDVTIFDRENPSVQRAIMDKRLSEENIAGYSTRQERIEVARVLGFKYVAGGELSIKDDVVSLRMWMAEVGGKKGVWEASTGSLSSATGEFAHYNAIQTAASGLVIDITGRAFAQVKADDTAAAVVEQGTSAIIVDQPPAAAQPSAQEIASHAEQSLQSGNLALAIEQYQKAINADPANGSLRIKLAEAYARKGLYNEAYDELGRAQMVGADAAAVNAAKDRVEKIRSGTDVPSKPAPAAQPDKKPTEPTTPIIINRGSGKKSAIDKIVEGDRLWKEGKPDEAAMAYKESIALDSADWRAHERLAVVNASMSLFNESRAALEQLKAAQPEPAAQIVANRYDMLRKAFDAVFAALLRQYDTDKADYEKKIITRESYYNTVKALSMRMESMTRFLDAVEAPEGKESALLRRSLASGLVAQAATSLLDYLESNGEKSKNNAQIFINQAKKEFETAGRLEQNKIVISPETEQ